MPEIMPPKKSIKETAAETVTEPPKEDKTAPVAETPTPTKEEPPAPTPTEAPSRAPLAYFVSVFKETNLRIKRGDEKVPVRLTRTPTPIYDEDVVANLRGQPDIRETDADGTPLKK